MEKKNVLFFFLLFLTIFFIPNLPAYSQAGQFEKQILKEEKHYTILLFFIYWLRFTEEREKKQMIILVLREMQNYFKYNHF